MAAVGSGPGRRLREFAWRAVATMTGYGGGLASYGRSSSPPPVGAGEQEASCWSGGRWGRRGNWGRGRVVRSGERVRARFYSMAPIAIIPVNIEGNFIPVVETQEE